MHKSKIWVGITDSLVSPKDSDTGKVELRKTVTLEFDQPTAKCSFDATTAIEIGTRLIGCGHALQLKLKKEAK